jgi:hypothetical protein
MIQPELSKWDQTLDDLRQLATDSEHARTRERFLALYMIASGQSNATQWAKEIGREDESVMNWVHTYNERGPDALPYRRTGGNAPLLQSRKSRRLSRSSKPRLPLITSCRDTDGH